MTTTRHTQPPRRPRTMALMAPDVFEQQLDAARLDRLAGLATLTDLVWTDTLDTPDVRERARDVEVLLTSWGAPRLTAERLDHLPALRAVVHCAGSVRGLVSDAFWDRGIQVTTAADANAIPVAEFTVAAVVLASKKVHVLSALAREHREDWSYRGTVGPTSTFGLTVGVVGFSRVGRRVVEGLRALEECTVLVVDPYADPAEVAAAGGRLVSLEQMLPQVDVLSLHAPSVPATDRMIGAAELAALPDHATLVNTARGSLVDHDALASECRTGRLHAILDVTDPEPLPAGSVLYGLPNVMLTPHVAGSLGTETLRMTASALDQLELYASGRPLTAAMTRERLEVSA
jgi:phosphoglycerate dehydrogenase-like enzyme